jgi:uncharacterized OsmC-like protein
MKMEKTGPMEFKTTFDKDHFPDLFFDEPPTAGGNDNYPNAVRILTAAVMNCLSASLTFCLTKSKLPMEQFELTATASTTTDRNEENRIRVKNIDVKLQPVFKNEANSAEFKNKIQRCVSIFQDYCVVSASVKQGIDITTNVEF